MDQQDPKPLLIAPLGAQDLYANGFSVSLGNTDVLVVLHKNGIPSYNLNVSYTFAKTLAQKLGQIVDILEKTTEHTIMTSDEVAESLKTRAKPV